MFSRIVAEMRGKAQLSHKSPRSPDLHHDRSPVLSPPVSRRPPKVGSFIPHRLSLRPTRAMSSTAGIAKEKSAPAIPRPSATVIVVNSRNEILLVHRNPKSTSFANAHASVQLSLREPF